MAKIVHSKENDVEISSLIFSTIINAKELWNFSAEPNSELLDVHNLLQYLILLAMLAHQIAMGEGEQTFVIEPRMLAYVFSS